MSNIRIKARHLYRSKDPKVVSPDESGLGYPAVNDRMVIRFQYGFVQYDSPEVKEGQDFPVVPIEEFLQWAHRDVTGTTEAGEWNTPKAGKNGSGDA